MLGIGRFIKVSLFISGLFCLAIMIAIVIGQQQPPSHWSTILHFNECELPCWIGIIPSQTTLAEARKNVREAYSDSSLYSIDGQEFAFEITYKPTGDSFGIALWTNDLSQLSKSPQSLIEEIHILLYRTRNRQIKSPTIPDLYTDLGNPEIVRLMSGAENEQVVLLYKEQQTRVFLNDLDCDRILLKEEITGITLLDDPHAPYVAWLSDPQVWQGFGRCYNFVRKIFP